MNTRNLCWKAGLVSGWLLVVGSLPGAAPSGEAPLTWPAHPRLIGTPAAWQELRERQAVEPGLRGFVEGLVQQARRLEQAPALEREMEGRRLLGVSREALRRILVSSFAWRATGEDAFLARARADLMAVAGFQDWNPGHFLDVAEMATAVAFGYDWLHAELSEGERLVLRGALVGKALALARDGHSSFRSQNNWNQVCIGGLGVAALAIADEEPELAGAVLAAGRSHLELGLRVYRPDGVYPEGPSYWEYGTSYTVLLAAALRSAQGRDWGILEAEGLKASAEWLAHMTAPSGAFYNFADGGAGSGLMPTLFFFARELGQPALLAHQHERAREFAARGRERFAPLAAFWWVEPGDQRGGGLPLFWRGRGQQPVAAWRSSWGDPRARYLAIKAGGAAANHAHMDGGSFVLEWGGVRWAEDLGLQSYHSLESKGVQLWSMTQNSERWRIFRLGPFSHNTLTLDGKLHSAAGMAVLSRADEDGATIDLTPIFLPGQARRVTRRVSLEPEAVVMEDDVEGAAPGVAVRWAMVSGAQMWVEGARAVLRQDGQRLDVLFEGGRPEVIPISEPATPLDAPNPGKRLLAAQFKVGGDGGARIRVRFQLAEQAK